MRGDAAIKSFNRCKSQIESMINKLKYQLNYQCPIEEITSELQEKWINCYEIYETDEQYLSYMFIVAKNIIRKIRYEHFRYANRHLSISAGVCVISDGAKWHDNFDTNDTLYVKIMNEIAVDEGQREENPFDISNRQDIIKNVTERLSRELHKKIFVMITEGMALKTIAEELGYTVNHIGNIRNKFIWPVVKDVMEINDDKYERLTASGRIFCNG